VHTISLGITMRTGTRVSAAALEEVSPSFLENVEGSQEEVFGKSAAIDSSCLQDLTTSSQDTTVLFNFHHVKEVCNKTTGSEQAGHFVGFERDPREV